MYSFYMTQWYYITEYDNTVWKLKEKNGDITGNTGKYYCNSVSEIH